ncbi:MAG: hypothetical protein K8S25_17105 [Alphaproteobacteria bacterium]|nr:hypothetical protein [Alphaproteobacteria bacterium]
MMRFQTTLALGLSVFGVAGCQTLNDVTSSVTGNDDRKSPDVVQAPAVVGGQTAAPTKSAAVVGGLVGQSATGLRAAWGEPTIKRHEANAELWQYGGASCTLLVYLYPGASDALTVSHAEAVPGGADEAAVEACAKAAGKPSLKPIS